MAVSQKVETKTITVIQETAADSIIIRRQPIKNATTNKVDIKYGVDISYTTMEYEGTSAEDKSDVTKIVSGDRFTLTDEQVASLFSTEIILKDKTKTVLGELIASLADSLISGDLVFKIKNRIRPWLNKLPGSPDTPSISIFGVTNGIIAGVSYSWSISLPDAVTEVSEDTKTYTISSPLTSPYTVTCTATDLASGVTEVATVTF